MDDLHDRHASHADMVAMTDRLVADYAADVPAGAVIACVARCREHLLRSGVRNGLVPATEAAARFRLAERLPARSIG